MIIWDEPTWKSWLVFYQNVINAYIAYTNSLILGIPLDQTLPIPQTVVIWQPAFDNSAMSLQAILQTLNSNGYLAQFQTFFTQFFGPNGIVAMGNVTSFGIPIGLETIVEYIRRNIDNELAVSCPACGLNVTSTNVTTPPPNNT